MDRMRVDPHRPEPAIVERTVEALRGGAVIAYPTETLYGLGANPFDPAAYERILELKGREAGKALSVVVADLTQLDLLAGEIPAVVGPLAERFWPGPLTLVVPVRRDLPGALAEWSTVAVRVSGLALAREIPRVAGFPLTATSANRSGDRSARTADEVEAIFGEDLDLILDGGPTLGDKPSTIIDVSCPEPRLLRRGATPFEEVSKVLRRVTPLTDRRNQS